MKPNFALSLSFEGITLLHRAAGGWRQVGEVSVSADDLAGELAMLRKTAASLEPGGVRSKLIIPASQIKYLTIDTIGLSDAARRKSAESALRGATPYEVSELVYDISLDGAKTHVAAVARETLAEAEAFAVEHRFHPVSFVAVPDDAPYLGEPFFGVTTASAELLEPGETVEEDGIAVVVVGAISPEPQPAPVPPPAPVAPPAPAPPPPVTPPKSEPAPQPKPAAQPLQEAQVPDAPKAPSAPKADSAKVPAAPSRAPVVTPQAAPETPRAATPQAQDAPAPAKPVVKAVAPTPPKPAAASTPAAPVPPKPQTPPAASPAAGATQPVKTPDAPVAAEPKKPTFSSATKVPAPSPDATTPGFSSRRTAPPAAASKPLGGAQRIAATAPKPDSSSLTQPAPVADAPAPAPAKTSFLSRRKAPIVAVAAKLATAATPAPSVAAQAASSEAERMTVFGARSDQVGGKPRFLGLILTVVLLVFLAGVAAWAAVFLDDGLAGLLRKEDTRTTASAPENQIDPEIIRTPDGLESGSPPTEDNVQIAALDPVLSAEDSAVLNALQNPRPEPVRPVITEQEAAARYAVSGIWPLAPETPLSQPEAPAEEVYLSTIDPVSAATDAIALPAPTGFETDVVMASVGSPPPFALRSDLSALGLFKPTAEGVVAPGGYTLIAASPPLKPPTSINRGVTPQPASVVAAAVATPSPLLGFRPKNRPAGLAERTERTQLGGVSRIELAAFRPSLRPRSLQDRARQAEEAQNTAQAEAEAQAAATATATAAAASAATAAALAVPQPTVAPVAPAVQNATRLATVQSRRPDTRPRNFARIVKRAERTAPVEETPVAAAATSAPRAVAPAIPSKTSVARSATVKNAINLRQVNLIGVYGKPSARRALIRLSNGRYQKVSVGDRIDGGRVSAIGNSELRYSKGGRNVVLKMP